MCDVVHDIHDGRIVLPLEPAPTRPGPMELTVTGHDDRPYEGLVDSLANQCVGLPSADLHDRPRLGGDIMDCIEVPPRFDFVAVLVDVLHVVSGWAISNSARSSMASRYEKTCLASSSSTFEMAKPTWTTT